MPKCKLMNGNIYSFTNAEYDSIVASGVIFIEKVEDDIKPDVLIQKEKEIAKNAIKE